MRNVRKREKKRTESKPLGGDMAQAGVAFVFWKDSHDRYELLIDNKLKGYTVGENDEEHVAAKDRLKRMAEEKGYTVIEAV